MKYFLLCLVALALSCGAQASNPCRDASGACVHIQVIGDVGPVDTVQLDVSGAVTGKYLADTPEKSAMALPIDIRLELPAGSSGNLSISASGFLGTKLAGQGTAALALPTSDVVTIELKAAVSPAVDTISPATGPTTGQVALTLRGKGFVSGPGLSVLIGGVAATAVTVISENEISATLPVNRGKLGLVDVVLITSEGQRITLPNAFRYYYGDILFSGLNNLYDVGGEPKGIVVADLNNDGWPDMAVINRADDTLWQLLNQPMQGTFTTVGMNNTGGAGSFGQRIVAGAFTGTSPIDLIVSQDDGIVVLEQANGSFPAPYDVSTPLLDESGTLTSVRGIGAGDFNKDGLTDVVAVNSVNGIMYLYHGNMSGLVKVNNYAVCSGAQQLVVADFNGDGNPDVAVACSNSNDVKVFLGTGTAINSTGASYPAGNAAWSLAAADVTGDGKLDLIVANWGTDKSISVLSGNGNGTFGSPTHYAISTYANSVAAADFDGDGRLDIAAVGYGTTSGDEGYEEAPDLGRLVILRNTGQGFMPSVDLAMLGSPQQVVSADFDRDGHPDLAISLFGMDRVQVLLNRSN